MIKLQKAQQKEKRLACPLQEKVQEYGSAQDMPLRDTVLEEKG